MNNYCITGVTEKMKRVVREVAYGFHASLRYSPRDRTLHVIGGTSEAIPITADAFVREFGTDEQTDVFRKESTNYRLTGPEEAYDLIREIAGDDKCREGVSSLVIRADKDVLGYTTMTAEEYIKQFGTLDQYHKFLNSGPDGGGAVRNMIECDATVTGGFQQAPRTGKSSGWPLPEARIVSPVAPHLSEETDMKKYCITGVTEKARGLISEILEGKGVTGMYNACDGFLHVTGQTGNVIPVAAKWFVTKFGTPAQQREFRKETTNYKVINGTEQTYNVIREIAGFDKCTEHASALYIFADKNDVACTDITAAEYIKMFSSLAQQDEDGARSVEDQLRAARQAQPPAGRIVGKGEAEPGSMSRGFTLRGPTQECSDAILREVLGGGSALVKAHTRNNNMIERDGPAVSYIVKDCPNEVLNLLMCARHTGAYTRKHESNDFLYTHTDNNGETPVALAPDEFLDKFGTVVQQQELVKITQLANSNLRMIVNTDVTGQW